MTRKIRWVFISAIVLIAGTFGTRFTLHLYREKKAMAYMQTVKMEPWAVGRYLIDVPQGAEVHCAQGYRGAGADIEVFPCSLFQTRMLVKERVEELQGIKHLEGGTLLERYVESKTLPNTWMLYRWNDRTYKGNLLYIDAYHWKEVPGPKKPFTDDAYFFKFERGTDPVDSEMIKSQSGLEDHFRRIRIRDNREIPTEPGFCMGHSFFPGEPPEGEHSEHASITFTVPGHPDIFVRYENQVVSPTTAASEKLLDRIERVYRDSPGNIFTSEKLRVREHAVGHLQGQEYLEMMWGNGLWDMQFQWEYSGVGESWEKPAMSLELTNSRAEGSTAPLSMTKEEAMALWDVMVDSIRLRPTTKTSAAPENGTSGTIPQSTAPTKPRAPLGTTLKTNEICTQTGIWECAHRDNQGGLKRGFREHQTLPEAFLDTKRGLLGKLMGRPAEILVDTTWTLVSYLDET